MASGTMHVFPGVHKAAAVVVVAAAAQQKVVHYGDVLKRDR